MQDKNIDFGKLLKMPKCRPWTLGPTEIRVIAGLIVLIFGMIHI